MSSKNVVLNISEWNTSALKYMSPKVNDKGGKSISIISSQTNRTLHISTPLMMTWGIQDFMDENGKSDEKYKIQLNFPNPEYKTDATDGFLGKLKEFEDQILNDAVKNSELWWGKKMTREICEYTFFPFLKYSKNKETKEIDYNRPPSIGAKVPLYNGKWGVEIYDTNSNMIFPSENENLTPMDFVPKLSQVACGLQCTGIWIGGKGWGLTWKMFQCIVKLREVVSVYGKCHISLSVEERATIDKQVIHDEGTAEEMIEKETIPAPVAAAPVTHVEDSDEEADEEVVVPPPAPVGVKKLIKKAEPVAVVEEAPAPEPVAEVAVAATEDVAVMKKKVVKKKVT